MQAGVLDTPACREAQPPQCQALLSGPQLHEGRQLPSDAKHARQQAAMIGQMHRAGAPAARARPTQMR